MTESAHDTYFKQMASSPAVAAAIIRPLLHPAVAAAIDWDSLELLPNEFTGDAGETTRADLIFRARFKGREGYIIVLLEHQSRPDPMMPWRALVYMVGIWQTAGKVACCAERDTPIGGVARSSPCHRHDCGLSPCRW